MYHFHCCDELLLVLSDPMTTFQKNIMEIKDLNLYVEKGPTVNLENWSSPNHILVKPLDIKNKEKSGLYAKRPDKGQKIQLPSDFLKSNKS